ncbi:hypothetical protein Poli38472_008157 [Pythium oligandrum]|uniref:Protein RFT1 homolog n=1 Tax=Pythium oligandrum TaxID=41045 RepID=A0A8K1CLL9_PYTOL|nr:hypothetical protein Poli38472_008157 [Pythium oligandrum]|eukprot:TMW65515.1 hypothetical protein Poli38472_008157 [Pythium oligandrum]
MTSTKATLSSAIDARRVATEPNAASPPPPPSSTSSNVLGRALRGGSYLFLQKILTFAINSFILRRLHLSVTGAVTVQFELVLASVFLFRDAFRLAFLRMPSLLDPSSSDVRTRQQRVVNAAWLSTLVSWLLAVGIAALMIAREDNEAKARDAQQGLQGYTRVLVMYCVAAMLEAAAEPMYLLAHSSVLVGWQVSAQGMGFLMRALVQYVGIFLLQLDGLLSYGIAEIAYAATLFVVFASFFYRKLGENRRANLPVMQSLTELLPRPAAGSNDGLFDAETLTLLVPLTLQSVVKYLLTEGDKWVLSLFTTMQQMGIYGIVFHLGSLVPRIVFFPLEEATKTIVSKMSRERPDDVAQTQRFVLVLLKVLHVIGMVFICFGVNYAYTLVVLLYGLEKAQGGVASALAMYCVYIPFLGLNGVCEAFVHAVGDKHQLMRLNQLMGVFFLLYATSAMLFMWGLQLDTVGIILANCVNMSCRILYCLPFMARYFANASTDKPVQQGLSVVLAFWRQALPDRLVLVAFLGSFGIGAVSQRLLLAQESWLHHGMHVAVGGVCFVAVLLAMYRRERHLLLHDLRQLRRGGDSAPSKPHSE